MLIIRKITQRYDPHQDRISLTAQSADGRVLLLWLTQRLANRLVAALTSWLDEEVKSFAWGESLSSLHTWEQSSAEMQLKLDQPIDLTAVQREMLVTTIDLARGSNRYMVTFKWMPAGAARLMFNPTELRQALIILHRLFDTAGWHKHFWPEWLEAGAGSQAQVTTHPTLH